MCLGAHEYRHRFGLFAGLKGPRYASSRPTIDAKGR